MDVTVSWENEEKSVLRLTLAGVWDWNELYRVIELQQEQCDPNQLSVVIDMRQMSHIPSDSVLHLQRGAVVAKEVGGKIVIIATSTAAVTMFRLFVNIYRSVGDKLYLVSSDEEAAEILGIS